MESFQDSGLDESNFGGSALNAVSSFDAFPKTKQSYLTSTRNGSIWTVTLAALCLYLTSTELSRWWTGETSHIFTVERDVARDMQINLDVVVAMACDDLHINVQDASGDRILAGDLLTKDPTSWSQWTTGGRGKKNAGWGKAEVWQQEERKQYKGDEDVHDFLSAAKGKKKFSRTPRVWGSVDACRVYGTLEGNKVQGDFHITARGHGYMDFGAHIEHTKFNFTHHINELSFGPFFPKLHNPLDSTQAITSDNFYKFQYYLSVVPTVYTDRLHKLETTSPPGPGNRRFNPYAWPPHTIYTNQYAVTEQSVSVNHQAVPGIFVKYDIEPIMLVVSEEWGGALGLIVRCVNVIAGVLVAGGWLFALFEWALDSGVLGKRRRGDSLGATEGLLHGREKTGLA